MVVFFVGLASFVAAALNAAAGGGTFVTFPTLTGLAGLSEKVANITSTVGLWPGIAASVVAARAQLRKLRRNVVVGYAAVGLIGGVSGAALLLHTSKDAFAMAVPWLLLFATVVFAMGKRVSRWAGRGDGPSEPRFSARTVPLLLLISVYNGYFGAGAGILLIGGLSVAGLHDLRQMNALKTVIQITANGAAVAVFAWGGVDWRLAGVMAVTATAGGFVGMALAQRVPQIWVRGLVLVMGAGLSVVYFLKAYGWG
jgi:uncharacterized membrane protein YfcA